MRTQSSPTGFTLPEVLVAIVIFLMVVGSASTLMISAAAAQRRALAVQELVSQTSYLSEYMSRQIRQARKETNQGCLSQQGRSYDLTHGSQGLKFINSVNQCHEFFLDGGRIKEIRGMQEQYLTPDDTLVTALNFFISGATDADTLQPKASVFFNLQTKGERPESVSSLSLQTTISQRSFDVQ